MIRSRQGSLSFWISLRFETFRNSASFSLKVETRPEANAYAILTVSALPQFCLLIAYGQESWCHCINMKVAARAAAYTRRTGTCRGSSQTCSRPSSAKKNGVYCVAAFLAVLVVLLGFSSYFLTQDKGLYRSSFRYPAGIVAPVFMSFLVSQLSERTWLCFLKRYI